MITAREFPRLLYLADIPVAKTRFGEILLYRLLEGYPAKQLRIIEPTYARAAPSDRLPRIPYEIIQLGPARLFRTRLSRVAGAAALATAGYTAWRLSRREMTFMPQVVLTTLHGYSWRTAAALSARLGIPLHIIIHDDALWEEGKVSWISSLYRSQVARVLKQAARCYCVSPELAKKYNARFSANTQVLFPYRSRGAVEFSGAAPQVRNRPKKIVYAGSIYMESYWTTILHAAEAAASLGMEMHIYADMPRASRERYGSAADNLFIYPGLKPDEFAQKLRAEADVLLLVLPFEHRFQQIAATSFPSRLTEYTAVGIPIVVAAPAFTSVCKWVKSTEDSALTVERDSPEAFTTVLGLLTNQPGLRLKLAVGAQNVCRRMFSYEAATSRFFESIHDSTSETGARIIQGPPQ